MPAFKVLYPATDDVNEWSVKFHLRNLKGFKITEPMCFRFTFLLCSITPRAIDLLCNALKIGRTINHLVAFNYTS